MLELNLKKNEYLLVANEFSYWMWYLTLGNSSFCPFFGALAKWKSLKYYPRWDKIMSTLKMVETLLGCNIEMACQAS